MGKIQEEELREYIVSISKKMDIDNCTSMVNTFMFQNFTAKSLIQYCNENDIPYFKRGQYDIFTLEEIEYIQSYITNDTDIEELYRLFVEKYPNRKADIEETHFKTKLEKLKLLKDEEVDDVRYTNEIIEYVKNIAQDFSREKVINLINLSYPALKITEDKLKEIGEMYKIEFYSEGDYGKFTLGEFKTFMTLLRTCKDMNELYDLFIKKYPSKFKDYNDFCNEADKLEVMKLMKSNEMKPREKSILGNKNEDEYVLQALSVNMDINTLYSNFNKTFSTKIGGLYSARYGFTEFKKKCIELRKQLKSNTKFTDDDVTLLSKLANGQRTVKQIIAEFENISTTKCTEAQFRAKLKQIGADVAKAPRGNKTGGRNKKYDDKFLAELAGLAKNNTLTECVSLMNDKYPEFNVTYKGLHLLCKRNGIKYLSAITNSNGDKVSNRKLSTDYINYIKELATKYTADEALDILKKSKYVNTYTITKSSLNNIRSRYGIKFIRPNINRKSKVQQEEIQTTYPEPITYKLEEIKELAKEHTSIEVTQILNERYNTDYFKVNTVRTMGAKNKIKFVQKSDFDEEDIKFINELLDNGVDNKKELYVKFCKEFPKKLSLRVFYGLMKDYDIYVQNNFPHLSRIKKITVHPTDGTEPSIVINTKSNLTNNVEVNEKVAWHGEQQGLMTSNSTELNSKPELEQHTTQNDFSKYQPIIDEVNTVFERKCKQLKKEADTHLHTQELVDALRLLQNYAKNATDITNVCNDHDDILEQYVREVEHEIENLPFQDEDPTLQNKIKVIRMRRREAKYVKDDIEVLKPLLDVIRKKPIEFNNMIMKLEASVTNRQNFVFIPVVDMTMVKKYNWCKQGSWCSQKVRTPILTTNKKLVKKSTTKSTTKPTGKKFRAKAEYMAFGNGKPFTSIYFDVSASNLEDARVKATAYFNKLSIEHNNSQYTIQDIYQINT